MKYDQYGIAYTTEDELFSLLYQRPDLDISRFQVLDPQGFNRSVDELYAETDKLKTYIPYTVDLEEFDRVQQANWHMSEEYHKLDIAQWLLDQCKTDHELQRVAEELLLYQERDLFDLLRYLKYFVDTMRKNGVVWGLGRGSSVASYCLYLIGVHRIDSMYYDLDIAEFLK
jgi:DNA polymerase III alpha subunit